MTTAVAPMPPMYRATQALRNAENSALNGGPSFYSGSGRDNEDENPIAKTEGKIKKKTIGVIATIALILVGGGTFLGMSNSLLVGAFEKLTTFATDSQYASNATRFSHLMRYQVGGVTKTTWTGAKAYTRMSSSFKKRLSNQGIEIEGKSLKFTSKAGEIIDIPANDFNKVFNSNMEFRSAFTSAKRGRVASFFDNIATKIFSTKLHQSRNEFRDYEQTGNAEIDDTNFKNKMSSEFDTNTQVKTTDYTKSEDDVPNSDGSGTHTETSTSSSTSTYSGKGDFAAATQKATAWLEDISKSVGKRVSNVLCGFMKIANMITTMVAANEIQQSITLFMGFGEPTSKTMAGLGTYSPINAVLNYLSSTTTTKISDYNKIEGSFSGNESSLSGELHAAETRITGSPLESNGLTMQLGGAKGSKLNAASYSLERISNALTWKFFASSGTALTCAVADGVSALVDGLVAVGSLIGALATGGLSLIVSGIAAFGKGILINAAIQLAAQSILSFAIPTVAKAFFTNIFDNTFGIEAGEYIARGAAALNLRNGSGSGQSAASKNAAISYSKTAQEVLALDAKMDQYRHNPFDISNQNTFLGSIAYSMIPVLTSSKITTISSFVRTANNSIASLISPVHAEGEGTTYLTTFGDCPMLEGIGATGDIYCNAIKTTDMSTIDLDPADDTYQTVVGKNMECDSEGACEIEKGSNLYKYFVYCSNRESPFGMTDQNILNDAEISTGNELLDNLINATPGVGDFVNIANSVKDVANLDWASGAMCVDPGDSDNSANFEKPENAKFWEDEGKYYQRYVEDTRLLDQMGAFDEVENPLISIMDEIEEEHKNDTYTEYLARISGLTVDNVEGILALAEVYQFTSDYDPSVRIAFSDIITGKSGKEVVAQIESDRIFFKDDGIINDKSEPIIDNKAHIAYFNLRDRNLII